MITRFFERLFMQRSIDKLMELAFASFLFSVSIFILCGSALFLINAFADCGRA